MYRTQPSGKSKIASFTRHYDLDGKQTKRKKLIRIRVVLEYDEHMISTCIRALKPSKANPVTQSNRHCVVNYLIIVVNQTGECTTMTLGTYT